MTMYLDDNLTEDELAEANENLQQMARRITPEKARAILQDKLTQPHLIQARYLCTHYRITLPNRERVPITKVDRTSEQGWVWVRMGTSPLAQQWISFPANEPVRAEQWSGHDERPGLGRTSRTLAYE